MCSRKKRFKDLKQAKRSVNNILRNTGTKMRYYKCEYCKGWHLSSKKIDQFGGENYVRNEIKKRRKP